MLEFFTALIIEYKLQGHQMRASIWFESERHCQEVLNADVAHHKLLCLDLYSFSLYLQ